MVRAQKYGERARSSANATRFAFVQRLIEARIQPASGGCLGNIRGIAVAPGLANVRTSLVGDVSPRRQVLEIFAEIR